MTRRDGGPEAWARQANPDASSLTYVGGDVPRLPLDEVRRRVLAELEELEAQVVKMTDALLEASATAEKAQQERDRLYVLRQEAREALGKRRAVFMSKFPLPPAEP